MVFSQKSNPSTMRLNLLLFAIIILLSATSCAKRINCPTYSDQELHKEIKVNSDQDV